MSKKEESESGTLLDCPPGRSTRSNSERIVVPSAAGDSNTTGAPPTTVRSSGVSPRENQVQNKITSTTEPQVITTDPSHRESIDFFDSITSTPAMPILMTRFGQFARGLGPPPPEKNVGVAHPVNSPAQPQALPTPEQFKQHIELLKKKEGGSDKGKNAGGDKPEVQKPLILSSGLTALPPSPAHSSVDELCFQMYEMLHTFHQATETEDRERRTSTSSSTTSSATPTKGRDHRKQTAAFDGATTPVLGGGASVRMVGGGMFEIFSEIQRTPSAGQLGVANGSTSLRPLVARGSSNLRLLAGDGSSLENSTASMIRPGGAPQFSRYNAQSETNDVGMTVIAEYEIVAELGRGSFGTVCLAFNQHDEAVAIKTMHRGTKISRSGSSFKRTNSTVAPQPSSTSGNKKKPPGPTILNANNSANATSATRTVSDSINMMASLMELQDKNNSDDPSGEAVADTSVTSDSSCGSGNLGQGGKLSKEQEAQQLVEREIAVMKALRHKNIVQLYAVIEDEAEQQIHLVMQYVENGPMAKMESDGSCDVLSVELAVDYMCQVSSGLDYLHRHGIIHRDIKPENILIGKGHTAYVADFGVSGVVNDMRGGGVKTAGTMAFFAPEMFSCADAAAKYGKESDVWAFGVSLYCITVGTLPFKGFNGPSMVRAVIAAEFKFPSDLSQEQCPDAIRDLIKSLLNPDPEKRMTLREFRHHPFCRQYQKTWTETADDGPPIKSPPVAVGLPTMLGQQRNVSDLAVRSPRSPVGSEGSNDSCSNASSVGLVPVTSLANYDEIVISEQDLKGAISHMGVSFVRRTNNITATSSALVRGFVNKLKNTVKRPKNITINSSPKQCSSEATHKSPSPKVSSSKK